VGCVTEKNTQQAAPPSSPPSEHRGSHDWHSAEYVRQWVADNEARGDARRAQFDLLADLLPFPAGAPISILDVGAGWGPVTRHLLTRFPAARATLLDYSAEMLAAARTRLAGYGERIGYVAGDLSQPGAPAAACAAAGGRFDAVVSSSCLHNVRPTERIPALYAELRAVTAAGGGFLNLDMVGTATPLLQGVQQRARIEQWRRRREAETGRLPDYAEAEAEVQAQRRRHGGAPAQPTFATSGGAARSLLDHLGWLSAAGFDAVECFWRQEGRALIGGYVAPA